MTKYNLDVRGMLCPMPVIKAQNFIADLLQGDVLEVVCTDPGAAHDIPAWCRVHGHSIKEINQGSKELVVIIEVGEKDE